MQIEDGPAQIRHLGGQRVDPRGKLLFGQLARAIPRRRVGVAEREQGIAVAEVDDLAIAVAHPPLGFESPVDDPGVVVAGHHITGQLALGQLLLRDLQPAREGLLHQTVEQRVLLGGVSGHGVQLLGPAAVGIHAVEPDVALKLGQLLVGAPGDSATKKGALPATVGLDDDGHDTLAGDVTAHNQDVRAIERPRVEELPPAFLRAVDIGGLIDARPAHAGILHGRAASFNSTRPSARLSRSEDSPARYSPPTRMRPARSSTATARASVPTGAATRRTSRPVRASSMHTSTPRWVAARTNTCPPRSATPGLPRRGAPTPAELGQPVAASHSTSAVRRANPRLACFLPLRPVPASTRCHQRGFSLQTCYLARAGCSIHRAIGASAAK